MLGVYISDALPYSTIVDWARRFREGRESIEDGAKIGRSVSAASDKLILEVSSIVEEDPYITLAELDDAVGISTGTYYAIVHDNMQCRKVFARWVPHVLTQGLKSKRV